MKKIVFTLPLLCPGGAERVVITLMNSLDKSRYERHLLALEDGPIRAWVDPDVKIHILGKKNVRHAFWLYIKKLKEIKPDFVLSSILHMNFLALLTKPFLRNTKFIIRESSLPSALMRNYGWKSWFCRPIYKFLYPYADLLICPSQQIQNEFQEIIGLKNLNSVVLYNPINDLNIAEKIGNSSQDDSVINKLKIITVGRLTFEKAYDHLVRVLPDLDSSYDWELEIIGDGPERQKIETLCKIHGVYDKVKLSGHKDNPWQDVAKADVFLLTSLWEGMPNAALESLVCGTPILALKSAGGIVEIENLASQNAVTLADTLADLVDKLNTIKPEKVKTVSLLPAQFKLENTKHMFEDLLTKLQSA